MTNAPSPSRFKGPTKVSKLCFYDRDTKGIKNRKGSFLGLRIPANDLGGINSSTTLVKQNENAPRRNSSMKSGGGATKGQAFFISTLEKMKDAVIYHLNKKKENEKAYLNQNKQAE
jgi:hypothetical protein